MNMLDRETSDATMTSPAPVLPARQAVFTNPFIPFPREATEQSIAARFEEMVAKYPQRLAIKTQEQELTYEGLNQAVRRLARTILAHRGVGEEPICLLLAQGIPILVGIMAVLKAGKIYVSLDPAYPPATNRYILSDSQAGCLVTDHQYLALAHTLTEGNLQVIDMDGIDPGLAGDNLAEGPLATADSLAFLIYTSGSTGQPKGVIQNHRFVLHNTMWHTNLLHLGAADRHLLISSTAFAATVGIIFPALLNGGALFPFRLAEDGYTGLCAWLIRQEITIYSSIPGVYRQFIASLTGQETFPKLRLIKLGGDALLKKDVDLFRKHFAPGCIIRFGFATTETHSISVYLIDAHSTITGSIVPVGYPVEELRVLLLDEEGQEVGYDTVGEIAVEGRYMAQGYWRQPELTRAKFLPAPLGGDARIYLTGDLGRMRSDGLLEHLGRKDFQVKIRGYRVELPEIELALLDQDNIKEAAVLAQPDPAGENRLVAYVAPGSTPPPTVRDLRLGLAEVLPDYKIPSFYVFLEALPHLPNGKLNRQALPIPDETRPELAQAFVAPRDQREEQLARIWEEVLHIQPVGIHDDFFELGGHSLLAAQIIARVIQTLSVEISVQAFFEAPTVARMAEQLAQSGGVDQEGGQDGGPPATPPITPVSRDAY
ncbi:MAG: amino acid adenylation domain-containing protein, partial [Chloroflexi bacterium]|nr:amino acid adenylation domain-containing protein [Chloroflexota bacterium]